MDFYPFYEVDRACTFAGKARLQRVSQEKITFDNPSDFQAITVFQPNI